MAQTGYTPILIYSSSTGGNAPAVGSLTNSTLGSELAINITDGKLFYKDNANAIQVIGWKVVPATAGGTGQTSYAVGDILYASSTTALSKLADVATGNALISGGVNTAPSWGKIGLTTHVTGTLGVANGGTGLATVTTGALPYGAGTSPLALLALVANQKLFANAAGTAPEFATGVKIITATRSATTASGNVSYTGVGFKPSLVIALMSSSGANGRWSVGSMDGTTQAMLYTNEVPNTQISTSYVGAVSASGGNQLAAYSSFDTDGFTLAWTKTGTPAADTYSLFFVCFR